MDTMDKELLLKALAKDFTLHHIIKITHHCLVVAAFCTMKEIQNQTKLYTVKVLFDDQSEKEKDIFENELQILSALPSHRNIVHCHSNFISVVPESFLECLPQLVTSEQSEVVQVRRKFIVCDFHARDLSDWLSKKTFPLCLEDILKLAEQILSIFKHLEENRICHLTIGPSDFKMTDSDNTIISDFQRAVQFEDKSFLLPCQRSELINTDCGYLAPEVLSQLYEYKRNASLSGMQLLYTKPAIYKLIVLRTDSHFTVLYRCTGIDCSLGYISLK